MMRLLITALMMMTAIASAAQPATSPEPALPAPELMMDAPAVPGYPEPPWMDSPAQPDLVVPAVPGLPDPPEPWGPARYEPMAGVHPVMLAVAPISPPSEPSRPVRAEVASAPQSTLTPAYIEPPPPAHSVMSVDGLWAVQPPLLPDPFIPMEPVRFSWAIESSLGLQGRLITMGLLPQFLTPDDIKTALDAAAAKVADEIESEGEITEKRVLSILDRALANRKEKLSKGASAILAVLLLERLKQMVCGAEPIVTCFRPVQ